MKLLGWDIEVRKVHSSAECPVCIMERMREYCPHVTSEDRYMPRHSPEKPWALKDGEKLSAYCGLGDDCRCFKMAKVV